MTDESYITCTNCTITNLLLKGQREKYINPYNKIGCRVDKSILKNNPEYKDILLNIYDDINGNDNNKDIKYVSNNNDNDVYNEKELKILRNKIQPKYRNHFMFGEMSVQMKLNRHKHQKKEIDAKDLSVKAICKLYNILCEKIKENHTKFFHIDIQYIYRPYILYSMFDNITNYDYRTPIEKSIDYYDNDESNYYYKRLLKRNTNKINKNRLDKIKGIDNNEKEVIMLNYIKCKPDMRIAIELNNKNTDSYLEKLRKVVDIYYVKEIKMDSNTLMNILYWTYDNITYENRLKYIKKKLKQDNYDVKFILFEIKIEEKNKSNKILKDVEYITEYFYQTIELSQIIFNKNTLELYRNQDLSLLSDNSKDSSFIVPNLKFQTLRKVLYMGLSLLELDRIIVVYNVNNNKFNNNIIKYVYGENIFDEITIFVLEDESISDKMKKFIENLFEYDKTKIYFLNRMKENNLFNNFLADRKIYSYSDLLHNPDNYFYFQGIKFIKI